jgi:hypothetical protein
VPHVGSLAFLGEPIPADCALPPRLARAHARASSVARDEAEARAAWELAAHDADPFFRADPHPLACERVEWAVRFGPRGLARARGSKQAAPYFSPPPGGV